MKKLFLFIGALSLVACSNDPIEFNDVNNPKIVAENVPGVPYSLPDSWELEITGNVLEKIKINSSQEDDFIYSSGQLVEINHYTNNTLSAITEFIYNTDGAVQQMTVKNASLVVTQIRAFNYSDPEFIEEVVTNYDPTSTITGGYTAYKKIINGNLVQYNFGTIQLDTYTYDSKENVFSNLSSLNELVLYYSTEKIGKNNRVNSVSKFYYQGNLLDTRTTSYLNQYDVNNKITESDVLFGGVQGYKVKFTY